MNCELDQKIWSVEGATRVFEGPFQYSEARAIQMQADAAYPKESFVVTTIDAAQRAIENHEQRTKADTV